MCGYVLSTGEQNGLSAGLAIGFQMLSWTGALLVLIQRDPRRQLRISDPGFLLLFWSGVYLVFPSIVWYQGGAIPFSKYMDNELSVELIWLHSLCILGFSVGYLSIRPPVIGERPKVDINFLPSGYFLIFLLSLAPLVVTVLIRLFSEGRILPDAAYGESWSILHSEVTTARGAGGLNFIWAQIKSKIYFYPTLVEGVGLGLLLSRAFGQRRYLKRTLLFVGIVILGELIIGGGGRSNVIMGFLIGLILADLLVGPIPWQYLVGLFVVGSVMFDFIGFFRIHQRLPVFTALTHAVDSYLSPDAVRFREFTVMLPKESYMIWLVRNERGIEGVSYFVQNITAVIPSQLLPQKLSWEWTRDIISRQFLGSGYYDGGGGVAGTIIGGGYRFAGALGVFLIAAFVGLLLGVVQRWGLSKSSNGKKVSLLQLCLLAGFLSWTFDAVRSDFGSLVIRLVYGIVVPWYIVPVVLSGSGRKIWLFPLPPVLEPVVDRDSVQLRGYTVDDRVGFAKISH